MTLNEAEFIRGHILSSRACKDSLLHYILDNKIELPEDVPTFETFILKYREKLPEKLRHDVETAGFFSDLVDGLFYRYNWLYSREADEAMVEKFDSWYDDVFFPRRTGMVESVSGIRIHDNGSIPFCLEAIALMDAKKWSDLDMLIKKRERRIKASRYKIDNEKGGFHYNPDAPIHNYKVQFRWGTVRTIVNEILGGLSYE